MAPVDQSNTTTWRVFQIATIYLIVTFLYAILTPGGEWPMPPWHYLSMALDFVLLVVVLVVRSQLFATSGPEDPRRRRAGQLFWGGVVSGVGLLAIRFTGDAAWWTGHLFSGL